MHSAAKSEKRAQYTMQLCNKPQWIVFSDYNKSARGAFDSSGQSSRED